MNRLLTIVVFVTLVLVTLVASAQTYSSAEHKSSHGGLCYLYNGDVMFYDIKNKTEVVVLKDHQLNWFCISRRGNAIGYYDANKNLNIARAATGRSEVIDVDWHSFGAVNGKCEIKKIAFDVNQISALNLSYSGERFSFGKQLEGVSWIRVPRDPNNSVCRELEHQWAVYKNTYCQKEVAPASWPLYVAVDNSFTGVLAYRVGNTTGKSVMFDTFGNVAEYIPIPQARIIDPKKLFDVYGGKLLSAGLANFASPPQYCGNFLSVPQAKALMSRERNVNGMAWSTNPNPKKQKLAALINGKTFEVRDFLKPVNLRGSRISAISSSKPGFYFVPTSIPEGGTCTCATWRPNAGGYEDLSYLVSEKNEQGETVYRLMSVDGKNIEDGIAASGLTKTNEVGAASSPTYQWVPARNRFSCDETQVFKNGPETKTYCWEDTNTILFKDKNGGISERAVGEEDSTQVKKEIPDLWYYVEENPLNVNYVPEIVKDGEIPIDTSSVATKGIMPQPLRIPSHRDTTPYKGYMECPNEPALEFSEIPNKKSSMQISGIELAWHSLDDKSIYLDTRSCYPEQRRTRNGRDVYENLDYCIVDANSLDEAGSPTDHEDKFRRVKLPGHNVVVKLETNVVFVRVETACLEIRPISVVAKERNGKTFYGSLEKEARIWHQVNWRNPIAKGNLAKN